MIVTSKTYTYGEMSPRQAALRGKTDWVAAYVKWKAKDPHRKVIGPPGEESQIAALVWREDLEQRLTALYAAEESGMRLFGDVAEDYISFGMKGKNKEETLAASTQPGRASHVRVFIERWGNLPIDQITSDDIGDWWEECITPQKTGNTGWRWVSALSAVYIFAVGQKIQVTNPTYAYRASRKLPRSTKASRKGRKKPTPIESAAHLAALDTAARKLGDPHVYLLILLLLHHGLRRGEAFAIRSKDMLLGTDDMDANRTVRVEMNRPKGMAPETCKSGEGRALPMARTLREHVLEFYPWGMSNRELLSGFGRHADTFTKDIFPKLCRDANIGIWRPKDLRSTFASQLITAGVPAAEIMGWMGHDPKSQAMFHDSYGIKLKGESGWGYIEPMRTAPGDVPNDLFARLCATPCNGLQRHATDA